MKLYFARHGESEANTLNVYSNRIADKYPLTKKGIQQAEELANLLEEITFTKIYCSPLLRTVQTSEILSKQLKTDFEITNALREYDTGILEEQDKTGKNKELYEQNENEWFVNNNFDHKIPDGESLNDIKSRFAPFIEDLKHKYGTQDANILIMGHAGLYQTMFPVVLSNIDYSTSKHSLQNCEFVIGELRGNNLYCTKWRDGKDM